MSLPCGCCGIVLRRTPGLDWILVAAGDLQRDEHGTFLRCPCCGNKERRTPDQVAVGGQD